MTRIKYFDGLKGLSALSVFIYHIAVVAFNNGFVGFGSECFSDLPLAKETVFNNFIPAVFTNNNLGFYLFLVMIAVFPVFSYRESGNKAIVMGQAALKRYFQLLIPCFVCALVSVLFYWNGLALFERWADVADCPWLLQCQPTGCETLGRFLKTTFITMWFQTDLRPLAPLWCLSIIYMGSLSVYASYALFGESKNRYLPSMVLAIVSLFLPQIGYFAVGSFVSELLLLNKEKEIKKVFLILLFIVGLLLVKLPVHVYPIQLKTEYLCAIGAGLLILFVSKSDRVQKLLSSKVLLFFGKISFEIFLTHFLVMTNVGCLVYELVMKDTQSPYLLTILTFVLTLPLVVLLSYLLHLFVSIPTNRLLKKLFWV